MWTVIYMAQSKEAVVKIQRLLAENSLAARIRPLGEGGDSGYFEILVPETEAQLAHAVLINNGY